MVRHGIVESQHGDMKLTEDDILIITAISDDRLKIGIARQVVTNRSLARLGFRPGKNIYTQLNDIPAPLIEVRRFLRPVAIQTIQIERGGAEIRGLARFADFTQW